jgi:hypothetical protein
MIAASQEKDEEDHGEEATFIYWSDVTRIQRNHSNS